MSKRRINIRAIVWRDGKILAVKHKEDDGSELPYWSVPGGGLDPMETLEAGVRREIEEETGVANVTVGKLLIIQQYRTKRKDFDEELEFFFHIEDSPAFDAVDLTATTHGVAEIARIEFVNPKEVLIIPRYLSEADLGALIQDDCATAIIYDL